MRTNTDRKILFDSIANSSAYNLYNRFKTSMDKESKEGQDGFKRCDEAVRQSTAVLFVTNNMDMFNMAIIVYVYQSDFTQSWTCTVAVNDGFLLHVDPSNLPGRVTKIACELDPIPEDGFLWFLNVDWHWIHDPAVLANDKDMPTIPVPLVAVPFEEEGVAVPSFPQLQFKVPSNFLLCDNLEDSNLGIILNLSQLVCLWHTLDWIFLQRHIREAITTTSDVRILVLDPIVFGLTMNWWTTQSSHLNGLSVHRTSSRNVVYAHIS
jgi:hypothetical protein